MPNGPDLITTAEAAEILGLSCSGVSRRVASGALRPAAKARGLRGAYFFERSAVQDAAGTSHTDADSPRTDARPPIAQAVPA